MTQPTGSNAPGDLTSNDKLLAAISYPIPIVGIVILVSESMKSKPFLKFHAVQSIAVGIIVFAIGLILSATVILACLAPVVWLATLYPAYKAYQGELLELPMLTSFLKNQHWI
jgi:uncharacterized membrane protein